jgi:hypothetical protein
MNIDIYKYIQHVVHVKNLWILLINDNTGGPTPSVFSFDVCCDPIPDTYSIDDRLINKNTVIKIKVDSTISNRTQTTFITVHDPNACDSPGSSINIYLPQYIIDQRENICSIDIKVIKQDAELLIPIKRIVECVQVNADDFDDHERLEFNITYKALSTISIPNFKELIMHPVAMDLIKGCIRNNASTEFNDTNAGRIKCLQTVDQSISATFDLPLIAQGTKNLVYYSVYFDKGYVELMNNSLMSIIKHTTTDFDVLIITDEATQQLIEQQPFVKHIQPKFHITSTPVDGVEASKNKTLIYDYADVGVYDKILFLDCDIVAVGDIASVFDVCVDHNRLYTARGINIAFHHHRSFHHGFDVVKQAFIDEMTDVRQYPFNAGQFMFRNSDIMRKHFSNLNWFMQAWPGEYFFEQAFMCYYFCKAKITNDALNSKLALISTVVENTYSLRGKTLLHFTAPPLDAITKINFINNFIAKHYEQSATSKI